MKVLCIGNSFSADATAYLHQAAKSAGVELETYNLYIGGCSLERHWNHVVCKARDYLLEINGESTDRRVSIQDMILGQGGETPYWDVITLQQASHFSTDYGSYQPYLGNLTDWLSRHASYGELAIHQTWAYEQGSRRLTEEMGYEDPADMFRDIKQAYEKGARDCGIRMAIPSGQCFQDLLRDGIGRIHRDTFHALIPLGRYVLSLVWLAALTGTCPEKVTFCPDGLHETLAEGIRRLVTVHMQEYMEKGRQGDGISDYVYGERR